MLAIPSIDRISRPEVFLVKSVLKICSKFTEEHPRRSVISIKLLFNFIEITLRHGCSPVNLLHIFKRPFLKNTSGRLLLLLLRFHRLRHSSSWFLYHLPGKQTWTNSVKYFWNEMPSFSVAIDSMISSVKSCHIFSLFGKCC